MKKFLFALSPTLALSLGLFCFGLVAEIGAEAAEKKISIAPAQSVEAEASQMNDSDMRRHGISLELLGRAGLYSFNYDYLLNDSLALGAGLTTYSISSGGSSASTWIIPLYANYYLTGGNHRLFVTGGADVIFASGNINGDSQVKGSGLAGVLGGGYEFRGDSGFLFRAAPYLMVGKASGAWLGLSLGYAI